MSSRLDDGPGTRRDLALEPVRLGLIGCGWVAEHCHLPSIRRLPQVELWAATDVDPNRLASMASRFGIPRAYGDAEVLLSDPQIEAVAVCVPAAFHVPVALQAIAAGKHVLVEKPLALDLDDCDELIASAAAAHVVAMVGFNLRFHRLLREARRMTISGELGAVRLIHTAFTSPPRFAGAAPSWKRQGEPGGGAIFEQAVHHVDLWRFVTGQDVDAVFAWSASGAAADESVALVARLANGALASSVFSEVAAPSHHVEILGDAGRVGVDCYRFDGLEYVPAGRAAGDVRTRISRLGELVRTLPGGIRQFRKGGEFMTTYRAEWLHFARAIRLGIPIESTLADGRRALEVVLSGVKSLEDRMPVGLGGGTPSPGVGGRPGPGATGADDG